ncbi:MAG: hypothetical protein FD166_1566 [Bacteroidetes bacterium]|nr:MAG: hypothetical protein FD166_1566 [Bacteroidota bacterium]
MKTTLITLTMLLASFAGMSQKNEYYQAMGETLGQYATCRTVEDFQALGNRFSMIAGNEKDEWLPLYYHAHCYIIMSFMEPSDAAKKDAWLDEAEKSVNKLVAIAPGEADVFALQAMLCTGRLVVNPMERGQQYSMLSGQAIGRALGIDPSNPRARLIKLQNDMGTARFYGKDTGEYCSEAKELLAGWDSFTPKSGLHPAWGKDQAAEIVSGCK